MAKKSPDQDACVVYHSQDDRQFLTFSGLRDRSLNLAKHLISKGIGKGDIIGLLSTNCTEFFVAFLALSRIGAPILLLRYGSTAAEVCMLLTKNNSRGLLGSAHCEKDVTIVNTIKTLMVDERKNTAEKRPFMVMGMGPRDKEVHVSGKAKISDHLSQVNIPDVGPDDDCVIFFTSGSSGEPKPIPCSHRTLIARTRSWGEFAFSGPDTAGTRFFNDRPLAWTGGFHMILNMCVFGACSVTMTTDFVMHRGAIEFVMAILNEEKCTHAFLMNYQLVDLMHRGDTCLPLCYLKYVVTVGQKTDRLAIEHVLVSFPGISFLYHYGLSENGFAMYQRHTDTTTLLDEGFSIHDGIEIKLIDSGGETVETGSPGEICIRSQALFRGYLGCPSANERTFLPGGWFRTGDIALSRTDGKVVLLGRSDDMIKRAPARKRKVVVVGVPDERLFEDLCACVIPRDSNLFDVSSFSHWCQERFSIGPDGRSLAPSYTLGFDEYPRTDNGKTSRKRLKEIATLRLQK
ncbi:long-chain-fatty-acid--CoA ligase 1-like [Lingula anatina]|uniref:Long-chain-fatty-acid--CoA ligase 1-like n=1 Tax=Lingula anatina TaxID=7574 RepID=A0A1S3JR05_LINAN|nr:long-chain-fatty-acid--CoA ligase 1-like [Lingula anatina]|eukprot:XP_013412833.1 long-chain-fatty-acid--CoA ligase 1-like [Lingula anatina]